MDKKPKKFQYDYWRPAVAADNVVFRFNGSISTTSLNWHSTMPK